MNHSGAPHTYNREREKRGMLQRAALVFAFFAVACVTTTSVTRTGTGLFAPREKAEKEEDEAPRGLSLSVGSIARDGTVVLELRNYSLESFGYAGSQDRPRLIIEVRSGDTYSRHTIRPSFGVQTRELPAGERIQLKTNIGGASGRVRIGIQSQEFGYIVWTNWIAL
jgi:hypothetical protein